MAAHLEMLAHLRQAYGGDALFRPSSISRLLGGCLGSVQLIARAPKEQGSSKFAEEGTAAHIVAEQALKGIRQPDEWTDRMVRLDDKGLKGHFVDEEMVESIQTLLDQVAQRWTPTTVLYVEQRLTLAEMDPTDPVLTENRGTGDIVLIDIPNGYIGIIDLKYGKGVMVPADTPQLKNYLLLALLKYGVGVQWKKAETVIVQPRAMYEHERIKPMIHDPAVILSDFMGKLVESMYRSLEPDPPLKAGKHCHWCRAAAICPALQQEALHIGRDAHDVLPTRTGRSMLTALPEAVLVGTVETPKPPMQPGSVFLPLPEGLSPDDCATILDREEIWDTWIKAVKHRAAVFLDRRIKVPGYKMVQRTGNRKWKAPVPATVDQLRMLGVSMSDMFPDPKLKTPAQIEKAMPKERRPLLASLVERPLGGPTLVKETDRRQAIVGFGMGPIEEYIESEATSGTTIMGPLEDE